MSGTMVPVTVLPRGRPFTVDDLDALLGALAKIGVEPEKPPFAPGGRPEIGRICFVQDPDGYRIELIDGGEFKTPQDP